MKCFNITSYLNRYSYYKKVSLETMNIGGKKIKPTEFLPLLFQWINNSFEVNNDGGSSAYYSPFSGWKASYPETTGYLIPTLLDYYHYTKEEKYLNMAQRAGKWLVSIQSSEGGWQGLQVDIEAPLRVFNSGMILDGLTALYIETKNEEYKNSALKGLDWILDCVDKNGLFTENNVDKGGAYDILVLGCCSYTAQIVDDNKHYYDKINLAIEAHTKIFMKNFDFIEGCNFSNSYSNTMLLHHVGYALDGLLICYEINNNVALLEIAKKYSLKLLSLFEVNIALPAYIQRNWKPYHDINGTKYSQCLTGYAQIAIVFLKLSDYLSDIRFRNAALKILDIVCAISNRKYPAKGMSYGVAGSFPFNGNYQKNQMVNWAAKYLAEAILRANKSSKGRKVK